MKSLKSKILAPFAAVVLLGGTAALHAQTTWQPGITRDDVCRGNIYAPIVGSWRLQLDVSVYPNRTEGLVSLNIGGIVTESDDLDLPQRVSPAFGVWQAEDCHHYNATFFKLLYDPATQTFERTLLKGSVVLSDDNQSFSGQLDQQFVEATTGQFLRSDIVTLTATRISIDATIN